MKQLAVENITTPIGTMVAVHSGAVLVHLDFEDCATRMMVMLRRRFGEIRPVPHPGKTVIGPRLDAYFGGDLTACRAVETDGGGTSFQRDVWAALRRISPGRTAAYSEIAAEIGRPRAVRAVARANALNPIAILVPCHRVIGKNGRLTGYAGGLHRKEWLLAHESRQ
jgi:methylated-DNA-[protein]-cysteine S-methyltransferase